MCTEHAKGLTNRSRVAVQSAGTAAAPTERQALLDGAASSGFGFTRRAALLGGATATAVAVLGAGPAAAAGLAQLRPRWEGGGWSI